MLYSASFFHCRFQFGGSGSAAVVVLVALLYLRISIP